MGRTNTPGFGGYLLAWAVSIGAFAVGFACIGVLSSGDNLADLPAGCLVIGIFVAAYSLPFALVGIPLVHLICRRVADQRVHVLAAAVAGLLPLVTFALMSGGVWGVLGTAWVPFATALGRWSVVPLVERRRRVSVPA